jgi:hypothetical protein
MTLPTSGPLAFTDIQTEFGGTNPIGLNEYYAGGSYVAAGTTGTYGAVPSSGQISVQNFYGTSAVIPVYIEDVFSTWLYTGTGASQTITNSIDLSTKGGMVWLKDRSAVNDHRIFDTARFLNSTNYWSLRPNTTGAQALAGVYPTTSGFVVDTNGPNFNTNGDNYASWTFRKQPKFFDVVTYTGTGANRTISHSLGSVPGCIIVKQTNTTSDWQVYHSSLANTEYLVLNTTAAKATGTTRWNSTTPTSSVFSVGTDATVNASGGSYVAYLFASNAGGFGLTDTDNVISCGSMVTSTPLVNVNLGYEPQWVMWKRTDATGNWGIADNMRGMPVSGDDPFLIPNLTNAEALATRVAPNATGFTFDGGVADGSTFIYIAIRRGPMKVPTDATKVFSPSLVSTGINTTTPVTLTPEASDWWMNRATGSTSSMLALTRLTAWSYLITSSTNEEDAGSYTWTQKTQSDLYPNSTFRTAVANIRYFFKRAPSFFDVVCYTGTGSDLTLSHNLQAVPQMIICKARSDVSDWPVYQQYSSNGSYGGIDLAPPLNGTTNYSVPGFWKATPTSSVFYLPSNTYTTVNEPGTSYVAYLFATCAGVSKVGSYTGTGALQTVNCGFAAGARFVMIKRTDSTGNWYVYDSSRGIGSGNDPYFYINDSIASVTGTNYVDTDTTGFKVTAAAPAGLNASGGTYIFLAFA